MPKLEKTETCFFILWNFFRRQLFVQTHSLLIFFLMFSIFMPIQHKDVPVTYADNMGL